MKIPKFTFLSVINCISPKPFPSSSKLTFYSSLRMTTLDWWLYNTNKKEEYGTHATGRRAPKTQFRIDDTTTSIFVLFTFFSLPLFKTSRTSDAYYSKQNNEELRARDVASGSTAGWWLERAAATPLGAIEGRALRAQRIKPTCTATH